MANRTKVTLKIVPFEYPSGQMAHRVTGMIHGRRVQKNFPTRQEAERYMNALLASAYQGDSSPVRPAATTFRTDEELREAELAFTRLRTVLPTGSLIRAVDYYLENAGKVIKDGDAQELVGKFIIQRRKRGNQENTLEVANTVLKRFLADASITKISEFTQQRAELFVFDESVVARTRRDRLDHLFNWARFLVKQGYLQHNFLADLDRPKVTHDRKPTTLTAEQMLKLLQAAAKDPVGRDRVVGGMLPYFAITSLSGVRPEEAERLGPDWGWYSKENALITGFRSKTGTQRNVEISPELVEILEYCRKKGLHPSAFTKRAFNRIRKMAGVYDLWDNDILRHTYASHHYAVKRDMNWLEKNMGNSAGVLKRSYLDQTIAEGTGSKLLAITLARIHGTESR